MSAIPTSSSVRELRMQAYQAQRFFALDPSAAKINAGLPRVAAHVIAALAMLAGSLTEPGQSAHGVAPHVLIVSTVLFIIDHVDAARRIRNGSLFAPDAGLRRAIAFVVPMLYTASFGVASRYVAAPTLAFLAMGGVARGLGGSRIDAVFVLTIFATALGLHWLTVEVSLLSVAAVTAAALLSTLTGVLGAAMVRHALETEETAASVDALAEDARHEMGRLAQAMSLHDGLSGLVFGVRAKLDLKAEPSELKSAVLALAQRTSEVLRPISTPESFKSALDDLSQVFGVPVSVNAVELSSLRPVEANDLIFAALELVANALRHGRPTRVEVSFSLLPSRVVKVTAGGAAPSAPASDSTGRGTRHLQLRAQAWGGSYRLFQADGAMVSEVSWPAPKTRSGPGWLALAIPLSASLLGVIVWGTNAPAFAFAFVASGVVLSAAVVVVGAASLRSTGRRIASSAAVREQALASTAPIGVQLEQSLLSLRASAASGESVHIRTALTEFSGVLQSIMQQLENRSAQR